MATKLSFFSLIYPFVLAPILLEMIKEWPYSVAEAVASERAENKANTSITRKNEGHCKNIQGKAGGQLGDKNEQDLNPKAKKL